MYKFNYFHSSIQPTNILLKKTQSQKYVLQLANHISGSQNYQDVTGISPKYYISKYSDLNEQELPIFSTKEARLKSELYSIFVTVVDLLINYNNMIRAIKSVIG